MQQQNDKVLINHLKSVFGKTKIKRLYINVNKSTLKIIILSDKCQ